MKTSNNAHFNLIRLKVHRQDLKMKKFITIIFATQICPKTEILGEFSFSHKKNNWYRKKSHKEGFFGDNRDHTEES